MLIPNKEAGVSQKRLKELFTYGPDFFEACCARKSAENRFGFHANYGR